MLHNNQCKCVRGPRTTWTASGFYHSWTDTTGGPRDNVHYQDRAFTTSGPRTLLQSRASKDKVDVHFTAAYRGSGGWYLQVLAR